MEDIHPRAGARGYLRCMLDSLLGCHPRVRYSGPRPEDFRTVVVTMGSAGASNAFAEVQRIIGKTPLATLALTEREVDTGSGTARLIAFGDQLRSRRAPTGPTAAMA